MNIDSARLTKNDYVLLTVFVLAACAIRLYFVQFHDVVSADGISYISIAKSFITGKGLSSALHYPPFYSILLGFASVVTNDFEAAGLLVSIAMGSLVAVPVYLLGIDFFSRRTGLIAAILTLTWPTLRYWSTNVMSQATYITLLLFGIYFLWNGYKKSSWLFSSLAGIFFACAHMTRSEAVLVFCAISAVLMMFTFINRFPTRKLLYVLLSIGVFFLVFSPYLFLLHDLTGKWQLTGKGKIVIADVLSEYLGRPDLKHDPTFKELGYFDLIRLYPDYIRTNYLKNIKFCWDEMLPVYGWVLAVIGFFAGVAGRQKVFERTFLLATFVPFLALVVFFFVGPEYNQPYLPVLFLFIGNALETTAKFAASRYESPAGYALAAITVCYGVWLVISSIPADRNMPYHYTKDGGRFDDKQIGLRLNKLLPQTATLMTRSGRIGFYSQRSYVTPPQTGYAEIVSYAKKNNIEYLVVTMQLINLRPQLEFLFGPVLEPQRQFICPPELELVYVAQEPGGLPYIIYRFK